MRIYSRKLKTGTYWYVDYRDSDGRRVRRSAGRYKLGKERAYEILADIKKKRSAGIPIHAKKPEFYIDVFVDKYFEHCEQVNAPKTVSNDRHRLKSFLKFIGDKRLTEITPLLIYDFQAEYLASRSRSSWNHMLTLIKSILNKAIEWQIIENNPIKYIKKLKIDQTFNYFTKEEIDSIMGAVREPLKAAVTILANTGMRRSELYNLTWKDVDFKNRRIIIQKSKSRKIRAIPMTDTVYNSLKEITILPKKGNYVCRPFKPDWYSRAFKSVLKKLGIKGKLHDLRHTFASHLVINGVQLQVVQELLGHRSITTTQIYAHLSPEVHAEAVKKLGF